MSVGYVKLAMRDVGEVRRTRRTTILPQGVFAERSGITPESNMHRPLNFLVGLNHQGKISGKGKLLQAARRTARSTSRVALFSAVHPLAHGYARGAHVGAMAYSRCYFGVTVFSFILNMGTALTICINACMVLRRLMRAEGA